MHGLPEVLASFEGAAYDDYGLVARVRADLRGDRRGDVEATSCSALTWRCTTTGSTTCSPAARIWRCASALARRRRRRPPLRGGRRPRVDDGRPPGRRRQPRRRRDEDEPAASRGHALFALHVSDTRPDAEAEGGARRRDSRIRTIPTQWAVGRATSASGTGKLTLVDLAGMESAKKSYAAEGPSNQPARREEAKNINTSLYALGTVIERLASGDVRPPRAVAQLEAHAAAPGLARRQLAVRDRDHFARRGEEHRRDDRHAAVRAARQGDRGEGDAE